MSARSIVSARTFGAYVLAGGAWLTFERAALADENECVRSYESAQEQRLGNEVLKARETLTTCVKSCPAPFRAQCTTWRAEIEQFLSSVRLEAKRQDGTKLAISSAFIDARPVDATTEIFLVPGEHTVRIETPEGPSDEHFSTKPTEHERLVGLTVKKKVEATPPPHSLLQPPSKTPAIVAFTAGGIALGAALGLTIYGHVRRSDLAASCEPKCDPDRVTPIRTAWWAAVGLGVIGAAGVTTGWLLLPKSDARVAVGLGRVDLALDF